MIESQPIEQYWDESDQQQQTQRQLYALHTQNELLKASLAKAQTQVQAYLKRILELHNNEIKVQSEHQKLQERHAQLQKRYESVETALTKRNDEYASLYNYLFVEPKRGFRELVMRQMELHNGLNQIQHDSDSQLIGQLRAHLKQRHEQIFLLSQEINRLNDALLDSTSTYQQTICGLKEENIRLQYRICGYEKEKESKQMRKISSQDEEICSEIRQKAFEQQLTLCEQEIGSLRAELTEAREKINQFQYQKTSRDKVGKSERPALNLGFDQIEKLINENRALKEQVNVLNGKNHILLKQIPNYRSIKQEVAQYLDIANCKRQSAQVIEQLTTDNQLKASAIQRLQARVAEGEKREREIQAGGQGGRTANVKTIDKLKKIISVYVPCFALYGFSSLGLDDQETQVVEDKSLGMESELNRLARQLKQKINDLGVAKGQIRQQQDLIQGQNDELGKLKQGNMQLLEDVERLSACLDLIAKQQQPSSNADRDVEEEEEQIEVSSDAVVQILPQPVCSESRLSVLERAVQQLQNDRCELLAIIRQKDSAISELQAKTSKLAGKVNVYNFVEAANVTLTQIQVSAPSLLNESQYAEGQKLRELRAEITLLNDQYERQADLLLKGQGKRYVELEIRYNSLLERYGLVQQRLLKLERENESKKSAILEEKRQEVVEMVEQPQNLQNMHNEEEEEDQNVISEFTIQTISDLLKKYQKQFSRFASLYDQKMANSSSAHVLQGQPSDNDNNRILHFRAQVAHLEGLLQHNVQIVTILEAEISAKEDSHRLETANLEQRIQFDSERISELTARLEESKTAISALQSHHLQSMISEQKGEASGQALNTAFIIINSKSQEIASLLNQNSRLSKLLQQQSEQLNELSQKQSAVQSPLAQLQLRQLQRLIEEEDLPAILHSFLNQLQQSRQASQQ